MFAGCLCSRAMHIANHAATSTPPKQETSENCWAISNMLSPRRSSRAAPLPSPAARRFPPPTPCCFRTYFLHTSVQVLLEMRSGGHVGAAARTWHPKDVLPCSELDNLFYFFLKVGVLLLDRILHRYINAFYHPTIIFFCGQQLGRAPAAHVDGPRHWPNKAKQGGQLDTLQLYLQGTARTTGLRAIKRPSHNHVACIACEVFSQICVL